MIETNKDESNEVGGCLTIIAILITIAALMLTL